ncbi:MAG: HYR domain-containing protein [Chloroflexi bacterium]|nr:HYR domain-containing protein [Chloroflexota bacterium]
MNHRLLHRAIALSLGALLAFAGTVAADSAPADGETAVGIQKVANLGQVAPGAVRSVDIRFVLTCVGTTHLDPGQTVTFGVDSAVAPEGGAILSVTDGTVGPLSPTWPADGTACPVAGQTFAAGTPSVVTVRAPMAPGPYTYSLRYHRSVEPFGVNDPTAINGSSAIEIVLVVNTPPSLTLPIAAMAGTIEANTAGGWTADWAGLGATDAEDVPDPAATCAPVAGTVLSLGTTSVTCGVTDGGGLSESASFDVTVADTAAPTLGTVPGDQSLTTGDPTGTTLTYTPPTATDVADADPVVDCLPASGSHVSVGTTTVTCTATDDSGNAAQATFAANVTYVQPHVATARWGEPIAGFESAFSANRGRTIPVKVELLWTASCGTTGKRT